MSSSTSANTSMTNDEMINLSSSWTLGCDNALLNRLKEFSQNVIKNSEEITSDCAILSKDINLLQCRVLNVTNQFLMLSNTQFVENCVQDFEERTEVNSTTTSPIEEKLKTKAEKEAELIGKMKEAIQIGVATNIQREQMSEEDTEAANAEAKSKLKLPHLIGSSKFFSSRYCGLIDESKPVIISNSTGLDLRSNASGSSAVPANNLLSSVEPSDAFNRESSMHQQSFFEDSSGSGSQDLLPNANIGHRPALSQGGIGPCSSSNIQQEQQSTARSPTIKSPSIVEDLNKALRARVPPPPDQDSDDSDDDFKPSASGRRLFEDDDDLFGEKSLFSSRQNDDNFLFGKPKINSNPNPIPPVFVPAEDKNLQKNHSIFEDSAEHDNIFAPAPSMQKQQSTEKMEDKIGAASQSGAQPKAKIPAGAVSMFGGLPHPVLPSIQTQSKQAMVIVVEESKTNAVETDSNGKRNSGGDSSHGTNDDNETASHSSLTSKGTGSFPSSSQGSLNDPNTQNSYSSSSRTKPKISALFGDDSDDDLFLSKSGVDRRSTNSSLFDDNPPKVSSNLHQSQNSNIKSKVKVKQSIFEDSDSGDDLFSCASSTSSKSKSKESSIFRPSSNIFSGRAGNSVFDDTDGDIFASSKVTSITPPIKQKESVIISPRSTSSDNSNQVGLINDVQKESTKYETTKGRNDDKQALLVKKPNSEHDSHSVNDKIMSSSKGHYGNKENEIEDLNKGPVIKATTSKVEIISGSISDSDLNADRKASLNLHEKKDCMEAKYESNRNTDAHLDSMKSINNPSKAENPSAFVRQSSVSKNMEDLNISKVNADLNSNTECKNKNQDFEKSENSSASDEGNTDSSTKKSIAEIAQVLVDKNSELKSNRDLEIPKLKASVKSIALNLKINPLALRPGSQPPKSELSDPVPSFDTPVSVSSSGLLTSIAKDRPKIFQRRRPPSRKLRKASTLSPSQVKSEADGQDIEEEIINASEDSVEDASKEVSDASNGVAKEEKSLPSSPSVQNILSPSTEEEDIFNVLGLGSKTDAEGLFEQISTTDDFSDLFNPSSRLSTAKTINITNSVDIFADKNEPDMTEKLLDKTATSSNEIQSRPSAKSLKFSESDSEDLFFMPNKQVPTRIADASLTTTTNSVTEVDDDDFFSSVPVRKDTKNNIKSDTTIEQKIIAGERKSSITEPTDIFEDVYVIETSHSPVANSSLAQNRVVNAPKNLFSDDESDDIFKSKSKGIFKPAKENKLKAIASEPSNDSRPSSSRSKNLKTKQANLFDSDSDGKDDLFSSVKANPKVIATKAVAVGPPISNVTTANSTGSKRSFQKKSSPKSLFCDSSDDDIFAPSSKLKTNKPTSTAETASTVSAKGVSKNTKPGVDADKPSNDLFDDPLNYCG